MFMTWFIPYKINIGWYSDYWGILNVRASHIIGLFNTNFGLKTYENIAWLELFMSSMLFLVPQQRISFIAAYVELTYAKWNFHQTSFKNKPILSSLADPQTNVRTFYNTIADPRSIIGISLSCRHHITPFSRKISFCCGFTALCCSPCILVQTHWHKTD